jgi:transcriptional regulator with XRE-family HTH domain
MKTKKNVEVHYVIENLIKIMNDRGLTKAAFARIIGFSVSKWNKISNGTQGLYVDEISNIAQSLNMREIDIYTYPKFCEEVEEDSNIKAQITIELKNELKAKVLNLVYNNKNIEILN